MSEKRVIILEKEKETKNTIRYKEIETEKSPLVMGTAYIQKETFKQGEVPKKISITIEWE
jgi:hypothetical protein